jgi:hypothetical protein
MMGTAMLSINISEILDTTIKEHKVKYLKGVSIIMEINTNCLDQPI